MNLSPNASPTLDKPAGRDKRAAPRWWALALFAGALAAVTWGSLAPSAPSLNVSNFDKVQHFTAYAVLAVLAHLSCRGRSWRVALWLCGFRIALEFAQGASALGREASVLDASANAAGVLLASVAWRPRRR